MSDPIRTVEIDRIVLTGLDVTPDRAEHIRALVEAALRQRLAQGEWPDGPTAVRHLEAPAMHVVGSHDDGRLAGGLAGGIAQAIRSIKAE